MRQVNQAKAKAFIAGTLRRAAKASASAARVFADPKATPNRRDAAFHRFLELVTVAEMHKHHLDSYPPYR